MPVSDSYNNNNNNNNNNNTNLLSLSLMAGNLYSFATHPATPLTLTLKVVVVWVLSHAAIDEGPGQVVHCVLLVLDRLGNHFCIEVVVEEVVQVRLKKQTHKQTIISTRHKSADITTPPLEEARRGTSYKTPSLSSGRATQLHHCRR